MPKNKEYLEFKTFTILVSHDYDNKSKQIVRIEKSLVLKELGLIEEVTKTFVKQ